VELSSFRISRHQPISLSVDMSTVANDSHNLDSVGSELTAR
jgi:hypothetical protein